MALARAAVGGGPKTTTAGTSSTASVSSNSFTDTASALHLILAGLGIDQGNAGTLTGSSTHSGEGAFTSILQTGIPNGWRQSAGAAYAKADASAGAGVLTVTRPAGNVDQLLAAVFEEITGYDTTTPIAQSNGGQSTSSGFSVALPGALTSGSIVYVVCVADGGSGAQTVPSGYTALYNQVVTAGWYSMLIAYSTSPPSTTVAFAGLGTGNNQAIVVEIKPAAGGGTAITKTPADALGLTDTVTRVAGRNRAPADNLGLTDVVARSVGRTRVPADNLGLVDAAARSVGRRRAPADQLGLSDAVANSLSLSRTPTDQIGMVDTVVTSVGRAVSPTDQLSLTDALTAERALARALNDPLGLTDGVSLVVSRTLSPGDTIGLTDTVTVRLDLQRSPADVLGLTDGITLARTVHVGLNDQLGLVDNALPVISGQGTQQVADVIGLTDSVTLTRSVHLTVGDQLGLIDATTRTRNLNRIASDQLGLTDAVASARTILRQLNDQLGLTDVATHGSGGTARLLVGDDPVIGVRYGNLVVSAIFVGTEQVWP